MASQPRSRIPRRSPVQTSGPTSDEDEIFRSVESDEVYIDPVAPDSFEALNPIGALYPDIRRRNPRVAAHRKPTSSLKKYLTVLSILATALVVLMALVVAVLNPAVERQKELLGVARILPIDINSIQYDAAEPLGYTSMVLDNLPALLPFNYTQGPSALPKLKSDLDLLINWLEYGKKHNIRARASFSDIISRIRKTQNDISQILRVRRQAFELQTLENEIYALVHDTVTGNGWPTVSKISLELFEAIADFVAHFEGGLGEGFARDDILQLLERDFDRKEGFDREAASGVAEHLKHPNEQTDESIHDIWIKAENERIVRTCRADLVDSIYKRLEKIVGELGGKQVALARVRDMFEPMVGEKRESLAGMHGRLTTVPMLRNWIRLVEEELKGKLEEKVESVEECGATQREAEEVVGGELEGDGG